MSRMQSTVLGMATLTLLGACVQAPLQPSIAVMPAPDKLLAKFQEDDAVCRQFAAQSVGPAAQGGPDQTVASGVIGTLIGAAAGALMTPHSGIGAAPGAAFGLLAGGAIGSSQSQASAFTAQRRYDVAYAQCMYTHGNQVPAYVMPASSMPPRMLPPGTVVPPPPENGYPPPSP